MFTSTTSLIFVNTCFQQVGTGATKGEVVECFKNTFTGKKVHHQAPSQARMGSRSPLCQAWLNEGYYCMAVGTVYIEQPIFAFSGQHYCFFHPCERTSPSSINSLLVDNQPSWYYVPPVNAPEYHIDFDCFDTGYVINNKPPVHAAYLLLWKQKNEKTKSVVVSKRGWAGKAGVCIDCIQRWAKWEIPRSEAKHLVHPLMVGSSTGQKLLPLHYFRSDLDTSNKFFSKMFTDVCWSAHFSNQFDFN